MRVTRILILILALTLSVRAAAPSRGADRLRQLVVFPDISLNYNFGLDFQAGEWAVTGVIDVPAEIRQLRPILDKQPDNVTNLLRLAYLLDKDGQTNESQTVCQKVARLCATRAGIEPQNGLNLTRYGVALQALGDEGRAESMYRHAALVSSNEWRCWAGLGDFLRYKFISILVSNGPAGSAGPVMATIQDSRPAPPVLQALETCLAEADQCYDRVLAVAPRNAEAFVYRAGYESFAVGQRDLMRHFRDGAKFDANTWLHGWLSPLTITNLQTAAELDPQNYEYLSLAAYFKLMKAMSEGHYTPNEPADLPPETGQYLRAAMARLNDLSQSPDKNYAAGAVEKLGLIQMVYGNTPGAVADFSRAVSLNPARDEAWDLWLGSQTSTASPEEKVTLCEARLKHQDSAWNHLLLARALEYEGKWEPASREAEAALKRDPDDLVARLELMALTLKQSADPAALLKVSGQLDQLVQMMKKIPLSKEFARRWREMTLNQAIYNGLNNAPAAQATARECLAEVFKHFPNDEIATAIQNALN